MTPMCRAGWCGVAVLVCASTATACPFCKSETGRQVQEGIFNDQFWGNVLLTALPFPILLAIVALIYFDFSVLWRKSRTHAVTTNPSISLTSTEI